MVNHPLVSAGSSTFNDTVGEFSISLYCRYNWPRHLLAEDKEVDMSLRVNPKSAIPEETARVAWAAFPKGNPYMTLRDELEDIYDDSLFVALFPKRGQPAESPGRLATITVLQFAEGLSDRQAADAVRSRIDWKYLLGLDLEDSGFNFSVLSEFRDRILAGGQEQRLLDELLERFRGQGLLKERDKQRTDSTHIEAAVRNLNRLECVGETMRHALNSLAGVAPQWLKARAPYEWYKLYGPRFTQYRLPKTKSKRKELSIQIGQDGQQLLTWAYLPDTPEEVRRDPAVETLRQVWIQQYYQDDQVHLRETDNMPSTARVIHTPYDLEARFSQKRQTKWFGYKAHLTETCDDDQPHLITHVETTSATTQDEQVTDTIHQALETKGLVPKEHLMDRGYVNTQVLRDSQKYGIEVVGPDQG